MSKINIDASLQSILDPLLKIARGTFAKDGDDETLTNTALVTFAGMGLVELVPGKNGLTWVPTQLLIEQSKQPTGSVARLVGIEGGVVSGVFNLESSGVSASDWRPRHDEHYHEA